MAERSDNKIMIQILQMFPYLHEVIIEETVNILLVYYNIRKGCIIGSTIEHIELVGILNSKEIYESILQNLKLHYIYTDDQFYVSKKKFQKEDLERENDNLGNFLGYPSVLNKKTKRIQQEMYDAGIFVEIQFGKVKIVPEIYSFRIQKKDLQKSLKHLEDLNKKFKSKNRTKMLINLFFILNNNIIMSDVYLYQLYNLQSKKEKIKEMEKQIKKKVT